MTFADTFHPDTLKMSRATGIRWNASGVNRWVSTDLAAETFAQIPAGTDGGSRMVLTLTVVSPEQMQLKSPYYDGSHSFEPAGGSYENYSLAERTANGVTSSIFSEAPRCAPR